MIGSLEELRKAIRWAKEHNIEFQKSTHPVAFYVDGVTVYRPSNGFHGLRVYFTVADCLVVAPWVEDEVRRSPGRGLLGHGTAVEEFERGTAIEEKENNRAIDATPGRELSFEDAQTLLIRGVSIETLDPWLTDTVPDMVWRAATDPLEMKDRRRYRVALENKEEVSGPPEEAWKFAKRKFLSGFCVAPSEASAPERVEMFEVDSRERVASSLAFESWVRYGDEQRWSKLDAVSVPPGKWRVVLERIKE